jgi:hypothetical protein
MGDQDPKTRSRSRQRAPADEEDQEPAPSDADRLAALEKQMSVLVTMVSRLQYLLADTVQILSEHLPYL